MKNFDQIFQEICIKSGCQCKNSQLCINNFVEEKFCSNDYWIDLIFETSNIIKESNKLGQRKTLVESHRDLLVRWLVQLNKNGEDSYSYFRSLKTSKNTIEYLKGMDNCLFSKESAIKICEVIDDLENTCGETLHYEHNPPVKVITQKLDNDLISDNHIVETICNEKYCVMIINSVEHEKINSEQSFSQSGSFDERCEAAGITKLYRINPEGLEGL